MKMFSSRRHRRPAHPTIVLGSTTRPELQAQDGQGFDQGTILEAQLPAQQYRDQGFQEGDTLVLTPRKAKVFVAG